MGTVVRIQDEGGSGPYNGSVVWGQQGPYSDRHPGPYSDSGLTEAWRRLGLAGKCPEYRFGFRDQAQMRAWFYDDQWLLGMKAAGMKLTVWEVEAGYVHYGNTQAVFDRDAHSRLVSVQELI